MTSVVVMNDPLVTRMVNDLVTKRRIPSFRSCRTSPSGLADANKPVKHRWDPQSFKTRREKIGASAPEFRQYGLRERLGWHGKGVYPKCQSPRLQQTGDSIDEASGSHSPQCLNGAGFLGPGIAQTARREDIRRPFFDRRPFSRRTIAPNGLRSVPGCPGLFCAKVFVCVVHHGIEPALRSCFSEKMIRDPFLQGLPKRKIVLLFSAPEFQEPRAAILQRGPSDSRKLICGFSDGAYPQKKHVPFREGGGTLRQLMPRHKEGVLQGFLLAVAPYVENEVCGVSLRHPLPVSGGGNWDCCSERFYFTNSTASTEETNGPAATAVETRRRTPSLGTNRKIARAADTAAGMSHRPARKRGHPITNMATLRQELVNLKTLGGELESEGARC
jgi:hypothetical protein